MTATWKDLAERLYRNFFGEGCFETSDVTGSVQVRADSRYSCLRTAFTSDVFISTGDRQYPAVYQSPDGGDSEESAYAYMVEIFFSGVYRNSRGERPPKVDYADDPAVMALKSAAAGLL